MAKPKYTMVGGEKMRVLTSADLVEMAHAMAAANGHLLKEPHPDHSVSECARCRKLFSYSIVRYHPEALPACDGG